MCTPSQLWLNILIKFKLKCLKDWNTLNWKLNMEFSNYVSLKRKWIKVLWAIVYNSNSNVLETLNKSLFLLIG